VTKSTDTVDFVEVDRIDYAQVSLFVPPCLGKLVHTTARMHYRLLRVNQITSVGYKSVYELEFFQTGVFSV